ncbi:uncharacterized protein LY89DRAFT_663197 [Mollisia scopiformis]|uniref:ubiquitinyl hydrolase 1 n=1 Tax=Mollisia scopiformis TaxID=149040 RepID=A0A194XWF6_MOLSC|nr:uncharacterized protein LY89DRAFT_663197 [Mollisia scopiformis]KUJ24466.1 hypothetical protein LY89DRAFT_663197 [Mollisia scopiformis]
MAAATAPLYESLFNHLVLNPRPPGHQDSRIDIIERAIIERVRDATNKLCSLPDNAHFDALQSLRRSLDTCTRVNAGGRLTRAALLRAFQELDGKDMIIIHVGQQNAGLLVRRDLQNQKNVIFEAFEASPLSEEVLATKSALQWDFPGSAVALSFSDFQNPNFQEELATFFEKASTESIKRFAARTNKAGSFAFESRDTVDPALITQMLMTLLETMGTRVYPPILRKRVRDDVSWSEGGQLPWRRCPFWLVLRVAVERHLSLTLGGEVGRLHYKFLIILVLSRLLDESLLQIGHDHSTLLKTKVCRRLVKIGTDKENAKPIFQAEYERLFKALMMDLAKSTTFAENQIKLQWDSFKKRIQRPIQTLPKYADERHLVLTLPNSGVYLNQIALERPSFPSQPHSIYTLPMDFKKMRAATKAGTAFAEQYFRLSQLEADLQTKNSIQLSNSNNDEACLESSRAIAKYLHQVADAYKHNPEQMSMMILNVMETWMRMDQAAVKSFPLLKDFNPGFPSDILDVLQLTKCQDITRLFTIRTYLRERHALSNGSKTTIFVDPAKGCFAERYYNESDTGRLQSLHADIDIDAEDKRQNKEEQWRQKTAEFNLLVQRASEASCVYDTDEYGVRTHRRDCRKCILERKVARFNMLAHEHPLPADVVQAKVVVFELLCPGALATYRDTTWRILSTLALLSEPATQEPRVLLRDYSELVPYNKYMSSNFTLASTTKSFLTTHYAHPTFPVGLEDICLPNGLKLGYWDVHWKFWPGRVSQRPRFANHCQLTLPSNSPFAALNSSPVFAADAKGPTTYEVTAGQSKCPPGLNVHEYLSFQSLFSGKSRRWLQVLVELGSTNINFSTEASAALINFLTLQAGPASADNPLGTVHSVASDEDFCTRLLEQLDHRLDGISFNWRETNSMEMLITIGQWLFEFSADFRGGAADLLLKAREITSSWTRALRADLWNAKDAATLRSCSRYLFWAALLCRRTFSVHEDNRILLSSEGLTSYIHASITLQDNLVADPASLPTVLKNALMRDFKMAHRLRNILKSALLADQACLPAAITSIWPDMQGEQKRRFSNADFMPEQNQWWVQLIVGATSFSAQQTVHFHLLEGHLLVDHCPIGKLPPEWRQELVLQQLFGTESLQTYPSSMPGMTYMLARIMNNHQIHLGFRNGQMVVRAVYEQRVLELVPPHVFGTATRFDLPSSLLEQCVHWLDVTSGIIEIRPSAHMWKSKEINWQVNIRTRVAQRRNAGRVSRLVDPHSPLFYRVAQTFDFFEERRHLTVFQPEQGRLTVELRRLALSFSVNSRNLLESPQLKAEVDLNQDAGTWYGLDSKLVLREVVINHDPITRYITSTPQRQRIILVPMGQMMYTRNGQHVKVRVENNADYARYIINDVLKRLECPAEPRLLYLKAQLHAYTSSFMPDPLTGRTGTEEAMHCLRSGYCQPWSPITVGPHRALIYIAHLTPRREYYPKELKVMQTTSWDAQLTTGIQHDGFRTIINEILAKSDELSTFSSEKIELQALEPKGDQHLTLRGLARRQLYQRSDYWIEPVSIQDQKYQSRDRWRPSHSRANVSECVNLLCTWPASFPTTSDLAGLLQGWTIIGGHTGRFEKILLSDVLNVELGAEWGSLVNLCRDSSTSEMYKLMFLFACMAFRHDANMDALKVLIAFVVFSELKVLAPPKWPVYTQFRQNQVPRVDYLVQLMKPHLVPYPGDERSTFQLILSHKQRKKFEALELAHEKKRESDAKSIAELLLKQWPCAEPQFKGFSEPVLVDVEQALVTIRPEWLRLFQNLELSDFISWVQRILNMHRTQLAHSYPLPVDDNIDAPVFPVQTHKTEFPSLQNLLCQSTIRSRHGADFSGPRGKQNLFASSRPLQELRHHNAGPAKTSDKSAMLQVSKNQPYKESQELSDLDRIITLASRSRSMVEQQYANDLSESLKALRAMYQLHPPQQQHLTPASNLQQQMAQAVQHIQTHLGDLQQSFEQGYPAQWLQLGGLWPVTAPSALLESLRSTATVAFGSGMRETIIQYALAITSVQRLRRIDEAYQKSNNQRMSEEQQNVGHDNWNPSDRPDWLLLEIDANILIRAGQVDVAMATISPNSRSNSVLQMNMGQGKTSCIIPMAAAVLADGTNLHRIVVPKPLLLQTGQSMHARLGGLLGRELRHVPFSRKTPTKSSTIELFLKLNKDMQKSRGIMLTLPEHILSFMLSGLQRLSDGRTLEASSMIKVQNWLSQRCRDVLDECDNILALRTQLIYPSGSQKTVDGHPHRWEVAEALLSQVNGHLHNLQRAYPRSIEVIPRGQGGFPVLFFLRKDVEDELIYRLVDDVYHGRTTILPVECTKQDRASIKAFISQAKVEPEVLQSISAMFPEKPAFRRVVYLLRGLLVHRILLMSLKKRWNVQYGLHPNRDPIAVPYHAKGTPSDQAEWGHPDVAILFTCLAFYYDGLNLSHLRQALEHVLKSDDPSQVYDRFVYASKLPDSLREWSAINVDDDAQLKEVWQHLRYNVVVVDYFLNNFVFPKHAKQFQVKLQASGWDIPLFQAQGGHGASSSSRQPLTTGFSGTNDWKRMLPLTINQHDLDGLSHTNAEVLTYLLHPRNRKYILAANSQGRHVSEQLLLHMITKERIRVLIDAGAQILEMDNLSLVKAWLDIYEDAPAAVFFDKGNKPIVLYRQGHQVPLLATPFADDLSSVLVYLDEAHTRGTDLKMPSDARGALTLGLGQTKDATVQAAMRLRQLGTTQSITFFAPPEVHHSILDLRKKGDGDKIDSFDVICWLIEQTCSGIEQLQPLFFSQGNDFCRRTQAVLDNPKFLTDEDDRESCLQSLRQVEQQTLEQLYGPNTKAKSVTTSDNQSSTIAAFAKELKQRRKGFKDTGNAVHGSALQEVEQEREVAYEVEAVREVQKPVHYNPYGFPGLHRDIISFATTGRMAADSAAYMPAFASIKMFALGKKHPINLDATSNRLYITKEFTRTVNVPTARIYDQFQRPVNWILWSPVSEIAMIVIPEEAELLLRIVKDSPSRATYLLTYAAPITRKMLHFNDLKYYTVPALPADWEAPMWLRIELGIFAGRLYFDYQEYTHVLNFLGVKDESGKLEEAEVDDIGDETDVGDDDDLGDEDEVHSNVSTKELPIVAPVERKIITRRPLAFMAEWLSVRRKGQDISETPMGFICAGKQLLESHPFFLRADYEHTRRGVSTVKIGSGNVEDEDEEEEKEMCVDNVYENVYREEDTFDDAELQEVEVKKDEEQK